MHATTLCLAVLALPFTVQAQGPNRWIFYAFNGLPGMLSYGRVDPIISPGTVSAHVHQIAGGNAIGVNYDYNTYRKQGTCSTVEVQDDLSNYWAPALYSYDGSSFSLMLSKFHIYYQFATKSYDPNNANGSDKVYPFPAGMTYLGGNMFQRSINYSDPRSTASIFQCIRSNGHSPYSHDVRDFQRSGENCDVELRATTRMPSCWDGVADNSDLTHVTYPQHGICPSSHPYAFMQQIFEWYWPVGNFPFDPSREDNWVFSYGDTTGFGFHGDFANGWNITLLQEAIDQCQAYAVGIELCPPFAKYMHTKVPPCMASGLYPDEDIGLNNQKLTALPGCNPLWTDNSTKPTCAQPPAPPAIDVQLGPDLSQWNYVSCPFSYTKSGGMLTAHSRTKWANMTVDSCLAECSGYKYALLTWGDNCYCDNVIQNGVSIASSPDYACQVRCPTDDMQFCGGFGSGALFEACQGEACHAFNGTLPAPVHASSKSTVSPTPGRTPSKVTTSPIRMTPSSTPSTTHTGHVKTRWGLHGTVPWSLQTRTRTRHLGRISPIPTVNV